jgi:hypothetical protein
MALVERDLQASKVEDVISNTASKSGRFLDIISIVSDMAGWLPTDVMLILKYFSTVLCMLYAYKPSC